MMRTWRRLCLALILVTLGCYPGLLSFMGHAGGKVPAETAPVYLAQAGVDTTAPTTSPALPPAVLSSIPSGAKVAVIRVEGLIYDYAQESLKQRMDRAVKGGASLIVIEIDTPGGLILSAIRMSKEIKSCPVPTVAWVNREAYSAGVMVSTACGTIVMTPASAIGDCAPIVPGQNLAPTERAKALAPVLTEMRDNARLNKYPYCLLQAMCMLGAEVYQIQNTKTGEIKLVNQADYRVMVKGETVDVVEGAGSSTHLGPAPKADDTDPTSVMIENATDADRGAWRLVKQVHDGRSLLTLNQTEAVDLGLAKAIVKDRAELQQFTRASSIASVNNNWAAGAAWWLTQPWARAILVMALLLGVWMEAHTPGMMIGGGIAALALILLIAAPMLVGLSQAWHLLILIAGVVLLVLELMPPPTFGLLAALGLALMFIGLVLSVVPASGNGPFNLPAPEMWSQVQRSVIWIVVSIVFSSVGFFFISRHFGRLPLVNLLVLKNQRPKLAADGTGNNEIAIPGLSMSGDEAVGSGRIAIGHTGAAASGLRPSGRAEIDGQIIDVVTQGEFIGTGERVRVVEVRGNRIVVVREG